MTPPPTRHDEGQSSPADSTPPLVADDFVPIHNPQMSSTIVDAQAFLHDRMRGRTHSLNISATLVWAAVDDHARTVDIVGQLAASTRQPIEVIDADVRAVLAQFLRVAIILREPMVEPTRDPKEPEPSSDPMVIEADLRRRRPPAVDRCRRTTRVGRAPWRPGGVALTVRTDDPTLRSHFADVLASLPPAARPEVTISVIDRRHGGSRRYAIFCDDEPIHWVAQRDRAAAYALSEVNRLAIERTAGSLRLHGGAVERDGIVVAILGPSGQGKSTLTAALVQRGWAYLTDEMVTVDPAVLRVEPFPKALDLSERSRQMLEVSALPTPFQQDKGQVPPTTLGTVSAGGQLGLLVILAATDDGDAMAESGDDVAHRDWLKPVDVLGKVLPNTFDETMAGPAALDQLAHMCMSVPAVLLARTDLPDACAAVDRWARSAVRGSANPAQ
jgi:hypothetical protein